MQQRLDVTLIVVFFISYLALPACSTNPVTGDTDFIIMSEQEEIAMGNVEHPKILKQFGRYSNQKLQRYVDKIGQKLAANSHRASLEFTFTVLDSPMVNAFALPGGHVYITRGMMAYLNTEAQLAAVLGHEIGHITARHGARQYSAATATSIGAQIGALFIPGIFSVVAQSLVEVLGTAMLKGYGRDYELQADELGAEYIAISAYHPQAMIDVIGVLKAQEEYEKQLAKEQNREPNTYHGVFASHPENDQRLQTVVRKTKTLKKYQQAQSTQAVTTTSIDPYLLKINGMVYGNGEAEGRIYKNRYYQAPLGISLRLPENWQIRRSNKKLVMVSPDKDAVLIVWALKASNNKTQQQQLIELFDLENEKLQTRSLQSTNGDNILTLRAETDSPFGRGDNKLAVVKLNNKQFVFLAAVDSSINAEKYNREFTQSIISLRPLRTQEQKYVKPLRVRLVNNTKQYKFATLTKNSPLGHHREEQLRLLNGMYPKGNLNSLKNIKIIQ